VATLAAAALCLAASAAAEPIPSPLRQVYSVGKIVPIPAAIPHEEGDMVDRRILPDLRWIAARFPNIYLVLPVLFNQFFVEPLPSLHRLGRALLMVGEDRLCYGTDAFLFPKVQLYIDLVSDVSFTEEQMEQYGYPEITHETRRKILGANMASALGFDLQAKAAELGLPVPR